MASIADPDHTKSDFCSNPTRKVRVIAKIRGFTDKETESCNGSSKPWISVHKHNEGGSTEKVTISFGDQQPGRKYAYDMDYCYEQNEDFGLIFSREIKPLVSGVIDGQNASVIAYGARGSGKTYTIQGSEEKPGLATLAMTEILSMAEAVGKYITVSFYEVFQDHVYDLLDSNCPEVQVFENAQGKVALKGLSQVSIKSIPEFHKLYYSSGCSSCKPAEKIALPRRSHKGLMIHMLSYDENSNTKAVSKMNFVDLAGYEDTRRNSTDSTNLGDTTKINRSLYALMNVIHALNTNEIRVPYRESKLTRVLQDSIGGTNRVLMLTCLNPSFCQDTMYTACLASRSFQGINQVADSTKRSISKSAAKSMVLSSLKNGKPATISAPMKKEASVIKKEATGMTKEVSAMKKETSTMKKEASRIKKEANGMMKEVNATKKETSTKKKEASGMKKEASGMMKATNSIKKETSTMKKETNSRVCFHDKISSVMVNGRKLFDDGTPLTTSKQAKSIVDASLPIICKEEGILLPTANEMAESTSTVEKENSTSPDYNALETSLLDKAISPDIESNHTEATPGVDIDFKALTLSEEADTIEKENKSYLIDEGKSPPLSARLRELSNNLKFLCSSTPSSDQVAFTNALEPKTPVIGQNLRANDKWELARFNSPREMFNNRSSGMKNSLVHDTLQFLNSASKDELKGLKGIGEKRATYILELREESPEPFKNLDDLQDIGLSAKQIKGLMKNVAGELFS